MSNFFWYDVMTTELDAAEKFYSQVIGWSAAPAGIGETPYTVLSANGAGVAGIRPLHDDIPRTYGAVWTGYIHVVDIDEYAKRIKAAGGTLRRGPWNVSGVGRLLVAADPHGAKFLLMHPTSSAERPLVAPGTPMSIGWHELHSENWEDAFAFYSSLFGWSKGEAFDMGPMGMYQLFATDSVPVGGMMNLHGTKSKNAGSYWLYYFTVDDIDATVARVLQYGGKITFEPQQVAGGRWVAQAQDAQGGHFGMISFPKGGCFDE